MLQKFLQNKKLILSFAIFWTVGIFVGCSLPSNDLPKIPLFPHFDKVVHFTFFFGFTALWFVYFVKYNSPSTKLFFQIVLAAFLFGYGIEFYQKYCVVGRSFDVWDGVYDTLGSLFFYFFINKTIGLINFELKQQQHFK